MIGFLRPRHIELSFCTPYPDAAQASERHFNMTPKGRSLVSISGNGFCKSSWCGASLTWSFIQQICGSYWLIEVDVVLVILEQWQSWIAYNVPKRSNFPLKGGGRNVITLFRVLHNSDFVGVLIEKCLTSNSVLGDCKLGFCQRVKRKDFDAF